MKLNIAQVIGLNTDQKAAQVISSSRSGEDSFFAVLDLTCDDAFTKGRQILSELSDFYFDFESAQAAEKLNATFQEAQKKLETEGFAILFASISGKILYLIGKGGVEAYLKRSEKLSPLLSVGAPNQLISGFLQEGDRVLFATSSLISFLGEDLAKSLDLPLEPFEEEVTDRIGASNLENQGLAALLVEAELQQTEEVELPPLHQDNAEDVSFEDESLVLVQQDVGSVDRVNFSKKILSNSLGFLWSQKKYFPTSGRGRLVIAAILIVVIALGVGFKVKANKDAKVSADFTQAMNEANDDFNAAKGLASLNPADAKSKLDLAAAKVKVALNLKPKNTDAQNLKNQIEQNSGSILQQVKISDFPLFLDMDLVKKNFRATQISLSDGKILLLDPVVKTLVVIDLSKKSNQILAGSEQLGEASLSSLNGPLAFVYSKDKGLLRIDITNQKLASVSKKDSNWGEIRDIYSFAGNIYLLDSQKNQIWKYLPTADGYSDAREYLTKGTAVDLSKVLRMQIESSVYVLKSGGDMVRLTRGDKDNFSYSGIPSGIKDPKSFFVSSDTDNLYILDSGNSRLLILTKTGSYKGTISGNKFATATDLVVDEKGKKVYLLDGSKIFQVDLK